MCKSLNGFDFECKVKPFECDGISCCEDSPNPLCCLNGAVCSDETFAFNGTNSDDCQCKCDSGYIKIENSCVETCALNPCQEMK